MITSGVVIDGHVQFLGTGTLPEGTRVRIEVEDERLSATSREAELRELRESYAEAQAGLVRPARDVLKEIAVRHGLPLEPDE